MSFHVANNCSLRCFDYVGHLYLQRFVPDNDLYGTKCFIPDEDLSGCNVARCSICYVKAHHRNSAIILLLQINAYNV